MASVAAAATSDQPGRMPWRPAERLLLVLGLGLAVAVRLVLLPTPGFRDDIDEFVSWVAALAAELPLGRAYELDLTFPPVMVYVFRLLGAVAPSFADPAVNGDAGHTALMKLPASLADVGLGLGVAWALRHRPRWAVVAALAILLHPAVVYVSAWWGQFESIYTLGGLVGFLLLAGGRPNLAAVAFGVALMTKPQAILFFPALGGWYLGRYGLRGTIAGLLAGAATIAVLWLPFVPDGGPAAYARNLATYGGEIFDVASLRAWNAWWLFQEAAAGGDFVADETAVLGSLTLRHLGYAVAGLGFLAVLLAVRRATTPERLALGMATSVLVGFTFLTTMHERYGFAALVFLAIALPDPRARLLWLALSVVTTLNYLAAIPFSAAVGDVLPISGPLGVAGSVATVAITLAALGLLVGGASDPIEQEHRIEA